MSTGSQWLFYKRSQTGTQRVVVTMLTLAFSKPGCWCERTFRFSITRRVLLKMWKKDTNHMKPILQIYTGGFFFAKNVLLCYFYAACIHARHITHTHITPVAETLLKQKHFFDGTQTFTSFTWCLMMSWTVSAPGSESNSVNKELPCQESAFWAASRDR